MMVYRLLTVSVIAVATTAGCEYVASTTIPDTNTVLVASFVSGRYELVEVDGRRVQLCCTSMTDPGRIVAGELTLEGKDRGEYRWTVQRAYVDGDNMRLEEVLYSSGAYQQHINELVLSDSTGLGALRGVIDKDVLSVTAGGHKFVFHRWAPTVSGQYFLRGCWSVEDESDVCTRTEPGGTVISVIGGGLHIGPPLVAEDRYEWYLTLRYDGPDGASSVRDSLMSSGHYAWDGQEEIVLGDESTTSEPTVGVFDGSTIVMTTEGWRYEFQKLVLKPSG